MAEYLQRFFVGGLEGFVFHRAEVHMPAAKRWSTFDILSGAALAAASEGIFVIIHSCFKDKYFPCGEATQGIKEQGLEILRV
ncbi:hypothetical protein ACLB1O_29560 [Escherichia coli]